MGVKPRGVWLALGAFRVMYVACCLTVSGSVPVLETVDSGWDNIQLKSSVE